MSLVAIRWLGEDGALQTGEIGALDDALRAPWCWVDVTDPDQPTFDALAAAFGLHPLAVEDALHRQLRPKLDLYPDGGPFLVWLSPHTNGEHGGIATTEVDFFLCGRSLVTSHFGVVEAIDEVEDDAEQFMRRGSDWVLHAIIDRLTDTLLPLADGLGDQLEAVEDRMLGAPSRKDLDELYLLRRRLLRVHRIVSPQRDIVRTIARERSIVTEDAFRYFDDVVDHLSHAEEALETYRDIGSAVMDIYLSAQSNRLNEIMKVLTVVTVLIGAATLISGIYGMNLLGGMWPNPDAPLSFWWVIGSMLASAGVLSFVFRRMDWW